MSCIIEPAADFPALYRFFSSFREEIPYWFDVPYETWLSCMLEDTDAEGDPLFDTLKTFVAREDDRIAGFVQFGIPNFLFGTDGSKTYGTRAGIVRTLCTRAQDQECGSALLRTAEQHFEEWGIKQRFAFFHAFGMSCCAGHGKLCLSAQGHIEPILHDAGFVREHENVYYRRLITDAAVPGGDVTLRLDEPNGKGLCGFTLHMDEHTVGEGEVLLLRESAAAYLKWLYVGRDFRRRGCARAGLDQLCAMLGREGFAMLDTDTADGNLPAQRLYESCGFQNLCRTRSYLGRE